jgi:mRNA-degrading endonuclease toxin of MazEF toxin-antitoxin module
MTHEHPPRRRAEGPLPARFGRAGQETPVVVVQADVYNQRLRHAVVAQVTTNLDEKDDPACLFIDPSTPAGQATGLDRECLVCCTLLSLMAEDRLKDKIGSLPAELLTQLDACVKAALAIG